MTERGFHPFAVLHFLRKTILPTLFLDHSNLMKEEEFVCLKAVLYYLIPNKECYISSPLL